jgi:sirohydrochlorin cobaltochelatase
VTLNPFSDATLIVLGHGTTRNEDSSAPVIQHAAELRRRGIFAGVCEAFWKQEPAIGKVLAEVSTPRAFIVPLFISEGYFTQQVIPRELGFPEDRTLKTGHRTLRYAKPIGTHDRMSGVLLARAQEVVEKFPSPRTPKPADMTLFIAGHGTERNENSRRAVERQVELIRSQKVFGDVHAVFMEESPRIGECYALGRTRDIVVVPFFISDGLHCTEDIPVLLGEPKRLVEGRLRAGQPTWRNPTERHGKSVWYAKAAGTDPGVVDVILERVREMAG